SAADCCKWSLHRTALRSRQRYNSRFKPDYNAGSATQSSCKKWQSPARMRRCGSRSFTSCAARSSNRPHSLPKQCESMKAAAICKDEHRREDVREKPRLNGLDYIEVSEDQLTLDVYFLGKAPEHIGAANVRIEGGRRVRDVVVRGVHVHRNPNPE